MQELIDFTAIRADRSALVRELEAAGAVFKGDACPCPFHEDAHASASVYQSEDGGWRFKCHAASCAFGGDLLDVRARVKGVDRAEVIKSLRPDASKPKKPAKTYESLDALGRVAEFSDSEGGRVAHRYEYTNPETNRIDMVVFRIEREDGTKTFRQGSRLGDGYALKAPDGKWPIYNRGRVARANEVVVVEGEKCVHALHAAGITATTSPGGAGKASLADWSPLEGKSVYLWPDCDPEDPKTKKRTGIEHMLQVADELKRLPNPPLLYWVECDELDLPAKGDAADFVEQFKEDAHEAVREVLRRAKPIGALSELDQELQDAVSGARYAVPLPWPQVSNITRALLPGTVTILAGSPGSTKSFSLLQALRFWIANGHKATVLELEDGQAYHLRRGFAQICGNSSVTDDAWCKANPEALSTLRKMAGDELTTLQKSIKALPDKAQPTAKALLEFVRTEAEAGCRVIAIDPISIMVKGPRSWQDDEEFLYGAKRIIEKHKCSLVLVTHPRRLAAGQNRNKLSMDDLGGGSTYARFSQTILYLMWHEARSIDVQGMHGITQQAINRTMQVFKARNGRGAEGRSYGLHFDGQTLLLSEVAEIQD